MDNVRAVFDLTGTESCKPEDLRKLKRGVIVCGELLGVEVTTTPEGQGQLVAEEPEDLAEMREVVAILCGGQGLGFACTILA